MRIPPDVLKCVVFIGQTAGEPVYAGTGFFVQEVIPELPTKQHTFLVTAKHVAEAVAGNAWVRMNPRGGGPATLVEAPGRWFFHPTDPTADVAVMYWNLRHDLVDHMSVASKIMLTSREEIGRRKIGVGDEVFSAGVFVSVHGRSRNTPFVRKGTLAMLPDDKVRIAKDTDADVYLIESHSLGGVSGAPVFIRETISTQGEIKSDEPAGDPIKVLMHTGGRMYLLGLMHGHWNVDKEDLNAFYLHNPTPQERGINLGISIVVPAGKIREAMNHPELLAHKEQLVRKELNSVAMPVQDSAIGRVQTPGPEPEVLAIDLPMDEAVKMMFGAGKPPRE